MDLMPLFRYDNGTIDRVVAPEKFDTGVKKKGGAQKRYHAVDRDGLPSIGEKVKS